ncbi:DeoR faimly transcriptional regulator [Lampropedia cohaerens]|uniref:DeoR faimly transcriptional regulator n=1 Tax=Lampropedia cohaerens TaxID=1610491 RepID=A0A0U1Q0X4_9BURK|nr:DeoR/GlpR family DNA-binding transcription regulator [Lampropedia cohaerens]KKW68418.1 DeoR faimly transcriptional regulator [Lampropedia cohaerens]
MLKAERHQRILERIQQSGAAVTVRDLAQAFCTSPITIRRDLIELGERGLLERTHGGAIATREVLAEGSARYEMYSYPERHLQQATEKAQIAECAAQFVSDGDSILINAGTTAHALAQALRGHQDLHVITNGLTVAAALSQSHLAHVYVLAGRLDARKQATIERPDSDGFPDIQIREAFLGVHAVCASGIYMRDNEDAAMNRAFVASACLVTVLADHTKLTAHASFRICGWSQVHRLITDPGADAHVLESIRSQGVEVVVCGQDGAATSA